MPQQRAEARFVLGVSITAVDADTGDELGEVVNVSPSGLMLASEGPLPIERYYRLRLIPPAELGEALAVTAEAAWQVRSLDPPCIKTGFRDLAIAEADRPMLERLIEEGDRVDPL